MLKKVSPSLGFPDNASKLFSAIDIFAGVNRSDKFPLNVKLFTDATRTNGKEVYRSKNDTVGLVKSLLCNGHSLNNPAKELQSWQNYAKAFAKKLVGLKGLASVVLVILKRILTVC